MIRSKWTISICIFLVLVFGYFQLVSLVFGPERALELSVSRGLNGILFLLFYFLFFWFFIVFFRLIMRDARDQETRVLVVLLFIVVVGLALRVHGLDYGLPQHLNLDEAINISNGEHIQRHPDFLIPRNSAYPSMIYYIISLASSLSNGWCAVRGEKFIIAQSSYIFCRAFMVFFSIIIIPLVFLIVREAGFSVSGGFLACIAVSSSPLLIELAHFTIPESPLVFFVTAAVWLCVRNLNSLFPRWDLAGLATGFALGTKYSVFPVFVVLAVSLMISARMGAWRPRKKEVIYAFLFCMIGFILSTPAIVIDWSFFIEGLDGVIKQYVVEGHPGFEGPRGWSTLVYYCKITYRRGLGTAFTIAMCFGFLCGIFNRPLYIGLLSIIPFFTILSQCSIRVQFPRVIIPALPFLAMYLASLPDCLPRSRWIPAIFRDSRLWLIIALVMAWQPGLNEFRDWTLKKQPETRQLAAEWVLNNLPTDATVGRMHYGPQLTCFGRQETLLDSMDIKSLGELRESGLDYLVLSEWDYKRFLETESHPEISDRYRRLFQDLHDDPSVSLLMSWTWKSHHSYGPELTLYQLNNKGGPHQPSCL